MSTLYVTEPPTEGKVILHTSKGEIEIELWSKEAPKACRNFVALALEGYYDQTVWHRIVPNFIVQTGDPTGTGTGGESFYGEPFADEFHQRLRFHRRGLVAMANAGKRNTNDSQFFITLDATPELQNKHTIFGQVAGTTIYNAMALSEVELAKDPPDRPVYPPKLLRAQVVHNPFSNLVPRITQQEREQQALARKRLAQTSSGTNLAQQKKKNTALLSFGEEEDVTPESKAARKPISSHDLLQDRHLSKDMMKQRTQPPATAALQRPPAESLKQAAHSSSDSSGSDSPHSETNEAMDSVSKSGFSDKGAEYTTSIEPRTSHHAVPSLQETSLQTPRQGDNAPSRMTKSTPSNNTSQGLLASILDQYRQPKRSKRTRESDHTTTSKLASFQDVLRRKSTKSSSSASRDTLDNQWDDDAAAAAEMREYGADDSDADDTDWRQHRFDSGGVPLSGNNASFSIHDYEVLDSRASNTDGAASVGFGTKDTVQQYTTKLREEHLRNHGRQGRDWT
ncbi:peptidylprolyl isomerase [Malassezia psittaci]|uniref:Peptidyl-prolyl isomerase CWC27 n=1 Tax=Malassezia psittaci TaxID=1821823 RepID=A0AAF0F8R2_9BASI|nr:peptidylprolyl isomerase [Malassezia psittaci]